MYVGIPMVMLARVGWDRVGLVALCGVLLANAAWLNRVLFGRVAIPVPCLTAIAFVLCGWLWQWRAFVVFFPTGDLPYGYFLTPEGAGAHLWVLSGPFWTGTTLIGLICLVASVGWWRSRARLGVICMAPWWLATFVVFSLPSAYFDGQGNASVFM
jgi:hypothetical protein